MRSRYGLAALILAFAAPLAAQESAEVLAARAHFQTVAASGDAAEGAYAAADLADLHPTDVVADRRSGATLVYLAQRHAGIEVYGAVAVAAVLPSGKVRSVRPRYHRDLARRVSATEPRIASGAALALAEARVRAYQPEPTTDLPAFTDAPEAAGAPAPLTFEASAPRLVYEPAPGGALRLAWSTTLTATTDGPMEMWAVRVDALTGEVLAADDLVARDRWHGDGLHAEHGAPAAPVSLAPVLEPAAHGPARGPAHFAGGTASSAPASGGASYRVIPFPLESPDRGGFTTVTDPADPVASPQGWHDAGSQQFTTTRGNNVWAYPDRDDDEFPDVLGQPQGGAGLAFDDVYNASRHPGDSREAATVNLFYWGNVFHDVLYRYGFDEAAGNFQQSNFSRGGSGNDAARLEAQSGAQRCNDNPQGNPSRFACYNNANFGTPPDGGFGRMQMYEWYDSPALSRTSPNPSTLQAGAALFGAPGTVEAEIVAVRGGGEVNGRACTAASVTNGGALSGKVALIERGECSFTDKVRVAQSFGAVAAVVHNNSRSAPGETGSPEDISNMAISPDENDNIAIPAAFVSRSTGISFGSVGSQVRLVVPPRRSSSFDVGVVAHEFGHGLSNRLTGGPSLSGCLSNAEQMGEGWSDYYGLLLTMTEASDTPRPIASYLTFEGPAGRGIRPAPYTRNMSVNPLTYEDVILRGGISLSRPHGIGSVWATMLWDMTLDLTDRHGFDVDVYNADGGAGNQIAMSLVTQGMKLQNCSPGFVDGRDAILEADSMLYNGANSDLIWAAFARRGLGLNASQGSSGDPNDGTADFSTPPVSGEAGPNASGAAFRVAGANPVRGGTTLVLALAQPEDVTVEVLDLLGRSVRTLHEGPLAGGEARIKMDARGLAPGVYVVRAEGSAFTASQRVTVVQ